METARMSIRDHVLVSTNHTSVSHLQTTTKFRTDAADEVVQLKLKSQLISTLILADDDDDDDDVRQF